MRGGGDGLGSPEASVQAAVEGSEGGPTVVEVLATFLGPVPPPPRRGSAACYWMTECGVATMRWTLICSRSMNVPILGEISFFQ
jgi:hypothetical protein